MYKIRLGEERTKEMIELKYSWMVLCKHGSEEGESSEGQTGTRSLRCVCKRGRKCVSRKEVKHGIKTALSSRFYNMHQ